MHSTCTVRRGGRWQVAGWPRGEAQGGVASRLIDKCLGRVLGPPSPSSPAGPAQHAAGCPGGRRLRGTYRPTLRRKDFQGTEAHKEKLEEDYHLLHRRPTASPDIDDSQ